ncbi:type II toxin-antitoxin system YafQ family toxin [Candidatus Saccharibacteria bacterium]|nr:type II toxin-antitoxin system YafQ family toxin [Candidatus Saccharibacteria bacterium]
MLKVRLSRQFRKDLQRAKKRGLKEKKIDKVVLMLAEEKKLPAKYRNHALVTSRNYKDMRECHIESDWLLIYRIEDDTLTLYLVRTGSHSDLF